MTNSNHKAILLLLTLFIVTHKSKAGTCDCPYTRINGKLLYSLNNALLPLQIESNVSQIFRPAFRAAVYDVSPNVVTGCGTALALGNGSSYITESNAGTSDGASSLKEKYDAAHISNPAFTVEYGGLDWSEFDVTINIANGSYTLWGDYPSSGTFDIKTSMRHEICHGLGLDHVNKQDELMYYGYSLDEEKVVTCGAQVGLQALHDICQPTPTPTPTNGGNYVSFDMTGSKLKWVTDEEEILGFNLYCAKDGKMISINDALILKNDLTEQYSYSILSEQKHAKLYLEVVQKNEICRIFAVN